MGDCFDDCRAPDNVYGHFPATQNELKAVKDRLEEVEAELERVSGLLFKFSKLFAEELNI